MISLEAAGITVSLSEGRTVGEIVAAAREGSLRIAHPDEVCDGHGTRPGDGEPGETG